MAVPDQLQTSNPPVARATGRWPIVVSLLALAAPMLLGQAGQVLLQLTDTLLIGHVGAVELAAASLAGNFVMFALSLAYGAVGAVSPTIAQLHGAGDRDGVSRTAEAGAWLALMIGGVIAVSLSGVVPLLEHLGQPPDVARAAWGYLLLIAWSMPGGILAVVLGQVAEAVDRPWPVFGFMVLAVVLNALLAWCLVFGHAGFPALGLPGAGLATFAARWMHAAALAVWMLSDSRVAGRRAADRGGLPRDLSVIPAIGRLFRQGLPLAAQDVLEGGAFAFGALMLGWVGTTALAAKASAGRSHPARRQRLGQQRLPSANSPGASSIAGRTRWIGPRYASSAAGWMPRTSPRPLPRPPNRPAAGSFVWGDSPSRRDTSSS